MLEREKTISCQLNPRWEKRLRVLADWIVRLGSKGIEVQGRENLPADLSQKAYIVAFNHLGWIEVPVLSKVFQPHWIYWMTKKEIFSLPILGSFLRKSRGIFPVDRGKLDLQALRTAQEVLGSDFLLGMAPEGTRGRGETFGQLREAKRGTVLIAHKMGVPIIPVGIWGPEEVLALIDESGESLTERLSFKRVRMRVNVGKTFDRHLSVKPKEITYRQFFEKTTYNLMLEIRDLIPARYHGFYAGKEPLPLFG